MKSNLDDIVDGDGEDEQGVEPGEQVPLDGQDGVEVAEEDPAQQQAGQAAKEGDHRGQLHPPSLQQK